MADKKKKNPVLVDKFREAFATAGHPVKSERGFALAIDSLSFDKKD
jgi:hypothetical protein